MANQAVLTGLDEFDRFWQHYPRRQAKGDALKAWRQLKPTPDLVDKMVESLTWQISQWRDPKYIPLPATWLRGLRWLDERPTIQAEPPRASGWYCRHDPPCTSRRMHQAAIEMGR